MNSFLRFVAGVLIVLNTGYLVLIDLATWFSWGDATTRSEARFECYVVLLLGGIVWLLTNRYSGKGI